MIPKLNDAINRSEANAKIPRSVLAMLNHLSVEGQHLLADVIDKGSEFNHVLNPISIASRYNADPKVDSKLYHYTDVNSLESIVKSKKFYIGRFSDMNDKQEVNYIYDLAKDRLNTVTNNIEEKQDFLNDMCGIRLFDIYIMSLTRNSKSMALQNYGDVAIEFNNQDIQTALSKKYVKPYFYNKIDQGDSLVFPVHVVYEKLSQIKIIDLIIKSWLIAYKNRETDHYDMRKIYEQALKGINFYSYIFKNPDLYQEEEIRYLVLKGSSDGSPVPDVMFNGKCKQVLPISTNMIKKVILSHRIQDQIESVKMILRRNGFYDTKVQITELPY